MDQSVSSPLAEIIRKAAQSKTEGPVSKIEKRFKDAGSDIFVLCDVSG